MKYLCVLGVLLCVVSVQLQAQPSAKTPSCSCEEAFLHVQKTVEENFSGYADRIKVLTKLVYEEKVSVFQQLSRGKFASDECPLIIDQYLDLFKSHHLGIGGTFDAAVTDTAFAKKRPIYDLRDSTLERLKHSTTMEGIYYFIHDSSMRVAVIKESTPLHDYIAVVVSTTRPTWKKGMIKFEGKQYNDSSLAGVLYMRNHRPKDEHFILWNSGTMISGDWRREGAPVIKPSGAGVPDVEGPPLLDAHSLSSRTFYLRIGSFGLNHKAAIDSMIEANRDKLSSTENLVLDLRDNGGGGDASWEPLIPWLYTGPMKLLGADVWSTPTTIGLMKQLVNRTDLPEETVLSLRQQISRMEVNKGRWIQKNKDEVLNAYTPKLFPKKVVIIIDRWCGSSTEEFLLAAKQSSKVILVGENTIGNLDYSNVLQEPLPCIPYTLTYATTRSRRLNVDQGIDNVGIAPQVKLARRTDWVKEALKIAEE